MSIIVCIFVFLCCINRSIGDHYKGGTITWKATNPNSLTSPIEVTIIQRHSWTLSRYPCNETVINTRDVYNDTLASVPATVECISSAATCTASLFQTINLPLYCTDVSVPYEISSGTVYSKQNLSANSVIDIAWRGVSWASNTLANSWSLTARIDLTPVGNKINTSPVTATLPIVQVFANETAVINVLAADWDADQIVRCRWARQMTDDECGNACFDLPNADLSTTDCAIVWKPVLRPEDIANGLNESTYVIAIQVEDFVNTTSTTPLSSIPHQMLVKVMRRVAGICANRPSISGFPRRDLGCYAAGVGSVIRYYFLSRVYCLNDTIVGFITTSPFQVNRTEIYQWTTYYWAINITWVPTSSQIGLQPFCVASVDSRGQTSVPYCVIIAVGGPNVGFQLSAFIQSSAVPIGTVMATQRRFSIQATQPLRRPTRNQTFIRIYRMSNGALVYQIDCKYSPDVYYLNRTIIFYVNNPPWIAGQSYYVWFSDGVATSTYYCGTESGSFGSGYWRFTIWNPLLSSTITPSTTTTTATTNTPVTTRNIATTSPNTVFTTTGIPGSIAVITTTTTSASTTSTTSTTTSSATTATTTTTTTTLAFPDAIVIYPKDYENACVQPATIATLIVTLLTAPLHCLGMIFTFIKMRTFFRLEALKRRQLSRLLLRQSTFELAEEQSFI